MMLMRVRAAFFPALLLLVFFVSSAWAKERPAADENVGAPLGGPAPAYGYDDYLLLPVRVHLLEAKDVSALHCRLRESDVRRIMAKAQAIWRPAGIYFYLESIVREAAVNRERFTAAHDPWELDALLDLRPPISRSEDALHVYFLHEMAVNGVWLGDAIFVMDAARLLPVEGGIDEPLPRVTSHELGHALGLRHRQDRTNLMASGTTGTALNRAEVTRARSNARLVSSVQTPAELADAADCLAKQGEHAAAGKLFALLAALPGDSALKRRAARRLLEVRHAEARRGGERSNERRRRATVRERSSAVGGPSSLAE